MAPTTLAGKEPMQEGTGQRNTNITLNLFVI